jgi:hypothetical protein
VTREVLQIWVKAMVGKGKRKIEAIGYMRTSSATNVGRDKDSEVRQRARLKWGSRRVRRWGLENR